MSDPIVEILLLAIGMGTGWALSTIQHIVENRSILKRLVEKELDREMKRRQS